MRPMKESVNWSAIARTVGDDVPKLDKLDETQKMYVLEEKVGDRNLSEINNTSHENIRNLPDFKIPENVMKSADDLGVRCNGDPHHEPAYRTLSSDHSPNSSSHYDSLRRRKHSTSFEQENPSPVAKGEGLYSTGSVYSQPGTVLRPPMLGRAPEYMDMTITLLRQENGFGFRIFGEMEEGSQAISHIVPGGAADLNGRMRLGDEIVSVDNQMVLNTSHRHVVNLIVNSPNIGKLTLGLRRRVSPVGEASQICELLQQSIQEQQLIQDYLLENEKLMQDLMQENYKLMQSLKKPELPVLPEILTFLLIPSADGLGIFVEGRRTLTANGSRDLGIFIRAVIPGGAASKDGRLKVNDRLVSVGTTSLSGMSFSCVMETLRVASTQPSVLLTVERITGQVGEHCKLPPAPAGISLTRGGVKADRAQGPGMQRKQRIPGRKCDDVVSTTSPNQGRMGMGFRVIFLKLLSCVCLVTCSYYPDERAASGC